MGFISLASLSHTDMILFLLLCNSLYFTYAATCPDELGWLQVGDSCYLVSTLRMSWYSAQEFCWGHGGYLAEIKSKAEEDLLDLVLVRDISYWIGLDDFSKEGRFVWAETHELADYVNWHHNDPSSRDGEDCVFKSLEAGANIGWYDYFCDYDYCDFPIHALCEY